MQFRGESRVLAARLCLIFILSPVVLAFTLPTAAIDLREQINWGVRFPLILPTHPPLQTWLPGIIASLGFRDAVTYVFAAQLLNAVGVIYLLRIGMIAGANMTVLLVIISTTIIYSMETIASALNADQLQIAVWSAVLYHYLRASEEKSTKHWVMFFIAALIACMVKYYAFLLLASIAIATIILPAFRKNLRNPNIYVGLACFAGAYYVIHLQYLIGDPTSLLYALQKGKSFAYQHNFMELYRSFLLYPALAIVILVGFRFSSPSLHLNRRPKSAAFYFTLVVFGLCLLMLHVAIAFGSIYHMRYSYPLIGFFIIVCACFIDMPDSTAARLLRLANRSWVGVFTVLWFVSLSTIHTYYKESASEAAALIAADWDAHYPNPPAYVIGQKKAADAIGLYWPPRPIGLSQERMGLVQWFSAGELAAHGAVVVTTALDKLDSGFVEKYLSRCGEFHHLELRYRVTFSQKTHHYMYCFIPPDGMATP